MADDLDDFFNDIEETAAEAIKDTEDTTENVGTANEVEASVAKEPNDAEHPPKKRQKVSAAVAPPIRPKGVVVAAASSSIVSNKQSSSRTSLSDSSSLNGTRSSSIGPSVPPQPLPYSTGRPVAAHGLPPLPPGPPPLPTLPIDGETLSSNHQKQHSKPVKRVAAGKVWVDPTLSEWPENDFRIFVGNLSRDVTDQQLLEHFQTKYTSTAMAKVVKDSKTGISKGFGFVSFLQPLDCAKAIREQDQKWLGSRPIRVKRSDWKDRNMNIVQKKQKQDKKKEKRFGGL